MKSYSHAKAEKINNEFKKYEYKYDLTLKDDKEYIIRFDGVGMTKAFMSKPELKQSFLFSMKEAIERSACEESIYHEIKTDSDLEYVCADITTKLIYFKYEEIMELISNNPEYQKNLIENYVKLKYCSNIKEGIYKIRENVPKSIFALNSLESFMKSNISIKSKGEKGNELQFIDGRRNF